MKRRKSHGCLIVLTLFTLCAWLPKVSGGQLIVSIAPDWNSTRGVLQCFEGSPGKWTAVGPVVEVLYGRSGLAWGLGIAGQEQEGLKKQERDGRAPAGRFAIGKIYTHDQTLPGNSRYPFRTIGPWDAWPDDPTNPYYNKHVVVDGKNPPDWFEKQKMRHGDFAYRWLVEIRHNSGPIVPGAGSAIFFHLRRGENRPSAGCTVMAQADLVRLIQWLDASKSPEFVLLPAAEYHRLWKSWGLPAPAMVPGT